MTRFLGLALVAAAILVTAPVRAETLGNFVPRGIPADAPAGFDAMCARDAALCGNPPIVKPLENLPSATRLSLLKSVNRQVNGSVRWVADRSERWDRPSGPHMIGDCEDFAIEKRSRLLEAGFPAKDLFYLIGYLPGVGLHAVLAAHTTEGDYILDNRSNGLIGWGKGPYVWILRQVAGRPREWRNLLLTETRLASLSDASRP